MQTVEFQWDFRTDKIRDDEGKVISKGRKHPSIKAALAVPTAQDLAAFLNADANSAESKFILEQTYEAIKRVAKAQIDDWREANGLDKDFDPTFFDLSKLSFTAVANTPKGERGAEISEEDWTAFLEDYSHTMVNVVGYDAKRVALHVIHFKSKLRRMKNDKPAIQKMYELLQTWATKSENVEDFAACYADLEARCKKYLTEPEKVLSDAL